MNLFPKCTACLFHRGGCCYHPKSRFKAIENTRCDWWPWNLLTRTCGRFGRWFTPKVVLPGGDAILPPTPSALAVVVKKSCETCVYRSGSGSTANCDKAGFMCSTQRKHPDGSCNRNFSGWEPLPGIVYSRPGKYAEEIMGQISRFSVKSSRITELVIALDAAARREEQSARVMASLSARNAELTATLAAVAGGTCSSLRDAELITGSVLEGEDQNG